MPHIARLARALVALIAAACLAGPAQAADPHPRIGLALGGGSARGLAHVGVLEWLHEHRIPIDAVAGTSIGGLVGGSYAAGLTEQELRALIENADWDVLLESDPPFQDKTFRRKQDRRAFPAGLQFGVRRGLYLPRSLNTGQQVALMIDRLALPYSGLPTFDDLPTPFRCVAFDIDRAEGVVLDHGILGEAMRATMALPGIFLPVTIDGRLLVDGGFDNNVPADVVRQMGVDVVIAVDVGRSPSSRQGISALSMLARALDAVTTGRSKRSLESADVVITPDVSDMTAIDWNKAAALRERGYRAAEALAARLLPYAMATEEYVAHETARRARRRTAPIVPATIVVSGLEPGDRETLTRQIRARPGRPLDVDQLSADLLHLSGTDRYELLTCHLTETGGRTQLIVTATPKPNGPAFLTLGAALNNIDASNFAASASGRTTVFDVAGSGSEVRLDFVVGTRLEASAELYRPILTRWLFAAPRVWASHDTHSLFLDGAQVAEYGESRTGAGFDLGIMLGRRAEFRTGGEIVRTESALRVGWPTLPQVAGRDSRLSARLTFDGQDDPVVPSRGTLARASYTHVLSTPAIAPAQPEIDAVGDAGTFNQAEADGVAFFSPTPANRLFVRLAGGTSFDARPSLNGFTLGGPLRMSAFRNEELRGPHYGLASAGYMRQLPELPGWVGGHGYLAAWIEAGSTFESRRTAAWHTNVGTGIVIDSVIGPLFAGGSAGPGGHRRLYVALGPLFR